MRALVQRVLNGNVTSNGELTGKIEKGMVVLLGIGNNDTDEDLDYIVEKCINIRIFDDQDGKMNLSLLNTNGEMLIISQFTLYADTRCGRRPAYIEAARPEIANQFYEKFITKIKSHNIKVATGRFKTEMIVTIVNDGPVTILLDSADRFRSRNK